ncbi:MAG TPA: GAF domain-containing protein [Chloroflexota bacterium]|nr:GAF domain-containing protein [Chloroflexota bacterium]
MADDAARMAQLGAELAASRKREAALAAANVILRDECAVLAAERSQAVEQQIAMGEILRAIASTPANVQQILDRIAETAAHLCAVDDVVVYRVDGGLQWTVANVGSIPVISADKVIKQMQWLGPINPGSMVGRAAHDKITVQVADIAAEAERIPGRAQSAQDHGSRTVVAVPMTREGSVIGVLHVRRRELRPLSEQHVRLLEIFADQAVIAIENARLIEELQLRTAQLSRSVDELRALGEVGHAVSSSLDINEVLSTIIANATRLAGADGGSLYDYDEATQTLARSGSLPTLVPEDMDEDLTRSIRSGRIRLGDGAVGRAVASRGPVEIADILEPGSYSSPIRDSIIEAGFRSLLAVPLLHQERPLGALVVVRRTPGQFSADVVALLQTFAGQCALAIHNARLFQQVQETNRALEEVSQ